MTNRKLWLMALAVPLAAPLYSSIAIAADDASAGDTLQEVVITAEKTPDTVQKTSASVQVVSGEVINQQGLNDIGDVLKDVPGVVIRNSAGGATIQIRGISSGGVPNNDAPSPIGLSTDGVYNDLAGAPSQLQFFDVNRVEVLRGPQGTLYGAGAEGGVVNVVSNDPDLTKYDANGEFEAGSYSLLRVAGMANFPVNDWLAVRAAGSSINRKGYYTSGQDDDVDTSGRLKALFKPVDSFSLLLGTEYTKVGGVGNAGGGGEGVDAWTLHAPSQPFNDLATGAVFPGRSQNGTLLKNWGVLTWDLGFGVLNALPSHINTNMTTYNLVCPGPPGSTCTTPNSTTQIAAAQQDAAEVSLNSPAESRIKWKIGGYYSYQRISTFNNNPAVSTLLVWPKSDAAFGQITLPVGDTTRLIAGLRQNYDAKSFYNTNPQLSGLGVPGGGAASWHHTDWKLGVEQDLTPKSMLYATVATGYRPGALNGGSAAQVIGPGGTPVANQALYTQPEELTSFEIGSKNQFLDDTLRVNADLYYYNYKNRQFTAFFFLSGPGLCPNGEEAQPQTGYNCLAEENANKARTFGAELTVQWLFTKDDELDLTPSYLNAKAAADQTVPIGPPPGPYFLANGTPGPGNGINSTNINGDTLPNSPEWQIDASLTHTFELPQGKLAARADVRYTSLSYLNGFNYLNSSEYTASGQQISQFYFVPANTEYDLSLTYTSQDGKWSLNGYGKNLGNEIVKTDSDGQFTQAAAPRTYGAVLSVHM